MRARLAWACGLAGLSLAAGPALAQLSPPSLATTLPTYQKPEPRPAAAPAGACRDETVYAVTSVNRDRRASEPTIVVGGTVPTGGWSHPVLLPISRSADGALLTFRLAACPPPGYATQALVSIEARAPLGDMSRLRTVVVVAQTGSMALDVAPSP
jgi:hypothetical protein